MQVASDIDWATVQAETAKHLRALIRLETVNPPGNESLVADYLKDAVENEGLKATIVEKVPGRGNFVTRIAGQGHERPLLLMAHSDVVPVQAEKWTHPPFAADVVDGMIWGRGAIDTKDLVACELVVILLAQRLGLKLNRDLIMCTFADEEMGTGIGARFMWPEHRDLIDAGAAINEGGGHSVTIGGNRFYLCQTGEKGSGGRFRMKARARSGHASLPRRDTAMLRMGRALTTLCEHEFPTVMTATVKRMLVTLRDSLGGEAARLIDVAMADPTPENLSRIPLDEMQRLSLLASTRNTAVPTLLHGGHHINTIPAEVICDVDGRVVPGQDSHAFVESVRTLLGNDVEIEELRPGWPPGPEAGPDSELFQTIRRVIQDLDPGADVVPFLVAGGTDAKWLDGLNVYGFMPGHYSQVELDGPHNHDERVAVENLGFATRALFQIVTKYCRAEVN